MINKTFVITTLSLMALSAQAFELKVVNPETSTATAVEVQPAKTVASYQPQPKTVSLLPSTKPKNAMDILASLDRTQETTACGLTNDNKPLSFYEIVDRAMCNDPAVRDKWLQLKNYKIEYDESYSDYLPRIEYNGKLGRNTSKSTYEFEPLDVTQKSARTSLDHSVQMSWLLFDFGKREAKVSKTKNEYLMYKMLVRSDLQDILLQVAQKYFNVMAAQANLTAIKNNEAIALRSYDTSRAKRLGGIGVLADELQAKSYVISSEYQRHKAEGNLRLAMGDLAIMIGYPLDNDIQFANTAFDIPTSFSMENIDDLLDRALEQHPKVLLAKQQILASKDTVKMAQRTFLPQVYLSGAVQSEDRKSYSSSSTGGEGNPYPNRSMSANVGVNVRIPIFNSLTNYNQVRQATNQLNLAENQYVRYEREVSLQVWNAYRQLEVATNNAKTAANLLENANQSYKIAEGRYQSGIGNILELLNTQNDLSSAEVNNVEVKVQWHTARLALASSLGMLEMDAIKNSTLNR